MAALALGGAGAGPAAGVHLVPRLHLDPALQAAAAPVPAPIPAPAATVPTPSRAASEVASRDVDGAARPSHALVSFFAIWGSLAFPGLGQAILGHYLDRGLWFTLGFVASVVGLATFVNLDFQNQDNLPASLAAGTITFLALFDVDYIWNVVDTISLVVSSPDPVAPAPRPLGAR